MARSLKIAVLSTILAVSCAATSGVTGLWFRGDGSPELIECAEGWEQGERARLGMGCVAFQPGVLLSRDKYKEMVVELESRWQDIKSRDEMISVQEARIKNLENSLRIVSVDTTSCEPCSCTSSVFSGVLGGTAAGMTACVLLTK